LGQGRPTSPDAHSAKRRVSRFHPFLIAGRASIGFERHTFLGGDIGSRHQTWKLDMVIAYAITPTTIATAPNIAKASITEFNMFKFPLAKNHNYNVIFGHSQDAVSPHLRFTGVEFTALSGGELRFQRPRPGPQSRVTKSQAHRIK
jgi:hypothetical protein